MTVANLFIRTFGHAGHHHKLSATLFPRRTIGVTSFALTKPIKLDLFRPVIDSLKPVWIASTRFIVVGTTPIFFRNRTIWIAPASDVFGNMCQVIPSIRKLYQSWLGAVSLTRYRLGICFFIIKRLPFRMDSTASYWSCMTLTTQTQSMCRIPSCNACRRSLFGTSQTSSLASL